MNIAGRPGRTSFDLRFALATAIYIVAIYWLSSVSDVSTVREEHPLLLIASNLAHAPVFAGLAYCVLRTISGTNGDRYAMAFGMTAVLAALDEWHQSFVPGRMASGGDWLLDLAGIACLLLFLRLRTLSVRARCEVE